MGKTFKRSIVNLLQGIIEVVYPIENYCIICKESECFGICTSCKKSINTIKYCEEEEILSYGYYGGVLKELILQFKFKSNFTSGDILSKLLEEYIVKYIEYEKYILTYIPLSKKSKKSRGFNQCEYIAKKISRDLSIGVVETLIKQRETKEQKTLRKDERYENIKDAFELKEGINLNDTNIILIDDVTTTGITLKEGYKILKKSGAKDIKLLTLSKSHI